MDDTKIEEGFKRCSRCGEIKPISDFNKNKGGKYGRYSICKDCSKLKFKEYYQSNKGAILQKAAEHRANNKDTIAQKKADYYSPILNPIGYAKQKVQHYRWMDKERGFDPNQTISAEWFLENIAYKPCKYCHAQGIGNVGANRIDNTKGHTEDNV